ncbi:hypothetical protein Tco_0186203 [Tanacetum coccineum]
MSNTVYSFKLINTAYPFPLDTAYQSSGIETEILVFLFDFCAKFVFFFRANPIDCLSLVSEYSKEEEAEAMAETMEQYMSKTRTDYGSGVARPKIEEKDSFELKGQFLKELQENTFSGSDNEDANEHIEKVLEIILDSRGAVQYENCRLLKKAIQNMEIKKVNEKVYAAQVGCEQCKGPHYTKDYPLKEEGKTLKEAYYTQFGGPFPVGGYLSTTPGFYQRNNANPSYQERRQSMEDTLGKFMGESAKRHEENSNLIKEI